MSEFSKRIDSELAPFFPADGPSLNDIIMNDIGMARGFYNQMMEAIDADSPPFDGHMDEHFLPGLDDDPDVRVLEYQRAQMVYPDCILIWFHGGGYVIGNAEDSQAQEYSALCPVISVDYRMAPEYRSPAAARDAVAVIEHIAKTRKPRKIIIGGPSAGAGLAAGAALLNRDRGGPELAFQLLIYPMLDDQHETPSGHMDIPLSSWNRALSLYAWSVYAEEEGASPYAAAARAEDLSGLPPAYVMCGELDLFLDDDIAYANRLKEAGVPVELALFPGAPHGFNAFAASANVSIRANASIRMALEHALC